MVTQAGHQSAKQLDRLARCPQGHCDRYGRRGMLLQGDSCPFHSFQLSCGQGARLSSGQLEKGSRFEKFILANCLSGTHCLMGNKTTSGRQLTVMENLMKAILRAASFEASQAVALRGLNLQRSHVSEVLAALLGYRSYSALVVEEADASKTYHLGDAEMLVLNQSLAAWRLGSLRLTDENLILEACSEALKTSESQIRVFVDIDDFYDSYAREALSDTIQGSDDVAAAMSDTNALFLNEPELPEETPAVGNLWESLESWEIAAQGDLRGKYDIDSDRMYTGNILNCWAKLTFAKAGRAGLILMDSEATGGVDLSWQEEDRAAEAEYWASQEKEPRSV